VCVCSVVPPLPPRGPQQQTVQNQSQAPAPVEAVSHQTLISITDPHIRQLINEGFDEDSATRALHLAKDNVQLARDILIEFGRR